MSLSGSATGVLATPPAPLSRLRRWLREPLLQFLIAGLILFAGYRALHPDAGTGGQPGRIEVTQDDLRQMTVSWAAQGRPPPTPEQIKSLVEAKVREEVLYREAIALGLDKNDAIVKRRMAQKMEFLAEDLSAIGDPKHDELKTWFKANAERFTLPPRVSFRHLYFSPDHRGTRARDDAARALEKLARSSAGSPAAATVADPFMFQDYFADRSFDQLASIFGPPFAQALVQLKPGSWQGPIESGYGWHLVWIDSTTRGRVPAFEEIEREVKQEWIAEQRAQSKRKAYEAMRARYQVVLTAPVLLDAAAGGLPAKRSP